MSVSKTLLEEIKQFLLTSREEVLWGGNEDKDGTLQPGQVDLEKLEQIIKKLNKEIENV